VIFFVYSKGSGTGATALRLLARVLSSSWDESSSD
jgi:hypothetical protein